MYHFPESPMASIWDVFAHSVGYTYIHGIGLVSKVEEARFEDFAEYLLDEDFDDTIRIEP